MKNARLSFDGLQTAICSAMEQGRAPHVEVGPVQEDAPTPLRSTSPAWQKPFLVPSRGAGPQAHVFRGHGDGMHMLLERDCLCGVLGSGTSTCGDVDGCCRKQRVVERVFRASTAAGDVAFLLSCNSANLVGQLGPENISIARALLQAGFSAVVGSVRQVVVRDEHVEMIKTAWAAGVELPAIVHGLNLLPEVNGAYIALISGNAAHRWDWEQEFASSPLSDRPSPRDDESSKYFRYDAVLGCLVRVSGSTPLREQLRSRLRLVATLIELEERELMSGREGTAEVRARLETALSENWRACVESGLLGGDDSSHGDVFQQAVLGRNTLSAATSRSTQTDCNTCGGELLVAGPQLDRGWDVRWCLGCGVRRITPSRWCGDVGWDLPRVIRAGSTGTLLATLPEVWSSGVLSLQVRDKSQRTPLVESTTSSRGGELRFDFAVPADAGPDIGSLRAVFAVGAEVAYLRGVFEIGTA